MARLSPAQLISAQPCTHASITAAEKTDAPSVPVCSDNLDRCRATQLGLVHVHCPCRIMWWSSTSASDPVILYISAFSCNMWSFMSLRANETFCVLFFSAVLVIWDEAAASSSALFSRVYNQNVLWDLQKGVVRSYIHSHEGKGFLTVVAVHTLLLSFNFKVKLAKMHPRP